MSHAEVTTTRTFSAESIQKPQSPKVKNAEMN